MEMTGAEERRTVLVVEDYEPNLMVAGVLLSQMNFNMDDARNGYAAVDKIKAGKRYAAILMDLQMQGMNGISTCREIRSFERSANLPLTPIIGITAHMLPGTKEACLAAGMNDFMTKPYAAEDLGERLNRVIER